MSTGTPLPAEPRSPALPLPVHFSGTTAFVLGERMRAALREGNFRPGRLIEADGLTDLIDAITDEYRPLVLLDPEVLDREDPAIARILTILPMSPVAILLQNESSERNLRLALDSGINCVLPSSHLARGDEFGLWLRWCDRGGPEPGVESHLKLGTEIHHAHIMSLGDKPKVIDRILGRVASVNNDPSLLFDLRLFLEETINNAICHAFLDAGGREKYSVENFHRIGDDEEIKVSYGIDARAISVAVSDNQGRLRRERILAKIQRQLSGEGILDPGGRGLYLIYSLAGRVIFNIIEGRLTQVIAKFPTAPRTPEQMQALRPLLIFPR